MLGYGDDVSSLYSVFIFDKFSCEYFVMTDRRDLGSSGGSASGRSRERSWQRKVETTVGKNQKNRHSKRHTERNKSPERTGEEKRRNRKPEEWKSRQKCPGARPTGKSTVFEKWEWEKQLWGWSPLLPQCARPLRANSTNTAWLMSKNRKLHCS